MCVCAYISAWICEIQPSSGHVAHAQQDRSAGPKAPHPVCETIGGGFETRQGPWMWHIVALAQLGRQGLMFDKLIQGEKRWKSVKVDGKAMGLYGSVSYDNHMYHSPQHCSVNIHVTQVPSLQKPCRNLTFSTFGNRQATAWNRWWKAGRRFQVPGARPATTSWKRRLRAAWWSIETPHGRRQNAKMFVKS